MHANERELDLQLCREILSKVAAILSAAEDWYFANLIADTLRSPDTLAQFLTSNELWGGSGSIADSALSRQAHEDQRRQFADLMIDLGTHQIDVCVTNVRTAMWVEAFSRWRKSNV